MPALRRQPVGGSARRLTDDAIGAANATATCGSYADGIVTFTATSRSTVSQTAAPDAASFDRCQHTACVDQTWSVSG